MRHKRVVSPRAGRGEADWLEEGWCNNGYISPLLSRG